MANSKSNNDKKRNRILFDFESIVDIKLSALRKHIIETTGYPINDFELGTYKINRMYSMKDILEGIDVSTYDLFHPEYPVFTSMRVLLNRFIRDYNGMISPKVLCKDAIQQRIIKDSFPDVKTLVGTRDQVKTINFARIVVGEAKHILEFKNPITVDFMMLNYRENFTKEDPNIIEPEVLVRIGDVNKFTIVKTYPEIKEPMG